MQFEIKNVDNLIQEYETLSKVPIYIKPEIVKDNNGISRLSIGNTSSGTVLGWVSQATSRTIKNATGISQANQGAILEHIESMNSSMTKYLDSLNDAFVGLDVKELNEEEINNKLEEIYQALEKSKEGLHNMIVTYRSNPNTIDKLHDLKEELDILEKKIDNISLLKNTKLMGQKQFSSKSSDSGEKEESSGIDEELDKMNKLHAEVQGEVKSSFQTLATQLFADNTFNTLSETTSPTIDLKKEKHVIPLDYIQTHDIRRAPSSILTEHDGEGPNFLGRIYSVFATVKQIGYDTLFGPAEKFSILSTSMEDAYGLGIYNLLHSIKTLSKKGDQLGGVAISTYLQLLKERGGDFETINDFYEKEGSQITDMTSKDVKSILRDRFKEIKKARGNQSIEDVPIIIPIVMGNYGFFERKHIVTVVIKNGRIEYYDAKGELSENKFLKDGVSLKNGLLKQCREIFLENREAVILENTTEQQFDSHRCGLFVMYFLNKVIVNGEGLESFINREIPVSYIDHFRSIVLNEMVTSAEEKLKSYKPIPASEQKPFDLLVDEENWFEDDQVIDNSGNDFGEFEPVDDEDGDEIQN